MYIIRRFIVIFRNFKRRKFKKCLAKFDFRIFMAICNLCLILIVNKTCLQLKQLFNNKKKVYVVVICFCHLKS